MILRDLFFKMSEEIPYSNGQLQYIMRDLFSEGVDPFLFSGACKSRDFLNVALYDLRNLGRDRFGNLDDPIFWFRHKEIIPSFYSVDEDYFVREKDINVMKGGIFMRENCLETLKPRVFTMADEKLFEKTLRIGEEDLAFKNWRLLERHPYVMSRLSEHLEFYPSDVWEKKFPGMIDTNVPDIWGDERHILAGEILGMFLTAISGKKPENFSPKLKELLKETNRKPH